MTNHSWLVLPGGMTHSPPSPTLIERMEYLFNALMDAVKRRRFAGCLVMAVVGIQLWVRVQRLRNRVLRLVGRIERGSFRAWVRRQAGRAVREMDPVARQRLANVSRLWKGIPRGRGWLLPLVPCDAALRAAQFEAVLREAEMRRLLAACPRLGRMLRPFCRMLGIDVALLVVAEGEVIAEAAVAVVAPAPEPEPVPVARGVDETDPAMKFVPLWQRLCWG